MNLISSTSFWLSWLFGVIASIGINLNFNTNFGYLAYIPWAIILILRLTEKGEKK